MELGRIMNCVAGSYFDNRTYQVAFDLRQIIKIEEADPSLWGWEHATWIALKGTGALYLNITFDAMLLCWRMAMGDLKGENDGR